MMERYGNATEAWLIRVLCATGMRLGELCAITAGQIEVSEQPENCGISLRGEQTKNGHPRWVPLGMQSCEKLRAIIVHGRRPLQHNLYEAMKRAVGRLGENRKISPHWCRHTANTRMIDAGGAELQVKEILGHLDGSMSQRYYHPDKAKLYEVAEKVQQRLGENRQTGEIVKLNRDENGARSA
jgi:integrase/recombinase XerD